MVRGQLILFRENNESIDDVKVLDCPNRAKFKSGDKPLWTEYLLQSLEKRQGCFILRVSWPNITNTIHTSAVLLLIPQEARGWCNRVTPYFYYRFSDYFSRNFDTFYGFHHSTWEFRVTFFTNFEKFDVSTAECKEISRCMEQNLGLRRSLHQKRKKIPVPAGNRTPAVQHADSFFSWIAKCRKGTIPKNSQHKFSPSWYSSVTEEYQDGEISYCEFFGIIPFLQLAIQLLCSAC
jgi:hypothetical protein